MVWVFFKFRGLVAFFNIRMKSKSDLKLSLLRVFGVSVFFISELFILKPTVLTFLTLSLLKKEFPG